MVYFVCIWVIMVEILRYCLGKMDYRVIFEFINILFWNIILSSKLKNNIIVKLGLLKSILMLKFRYLY